MLSLAQTLKDLSSKAKTISNNITETYVKNLISTEIERSITSSTDGPLYTAVKNAAFSNLPPKIGYGKEKTLNIVPVNGQLKARVYSQPIFLGGTTSIIPQQDITLPANKNNYIYAARDAVDYTKVNFEICDRMLTNKDKDIYFSRILCARFKTNGTQVAEQEKFETVNYSCF